MSLLSVSIAIRFVLCDKHSHNLRRSSRWIICFLLIRSLEKYRNAFSVRRWRIDFFSDDTWCEEAKLIVQGLTYGHILQAQVYDYTPDGIPLILLFAVHGTQVCSASLYFYRLYYLPWICTYPVSFVCRIPTDYCRTIRFLYYFYVSSF